MREVMLKKPWWVEGGLSPPGRALMDERPMLEDLASDRGRHRREREKTMFP